MSDNIPENHYHAVAEEVEAIEQENVRLVEGGVKSIKAHNNVYVQHAGVGQIEAQRVDIRQGGAGQIHANEVSLEQSGAFIVQADTVNLNQSGSWVTVGREVNANTINSVVFFGQQVKGEVRTLLDWRMAVIIGATIAVIVSILKVIFHHKQPR